MDYRSVLLVVGLAGAGLAAATTACSGPDPGEITFRERPRGSSGELTSGGTSGLVEGGTDEGGTPGDGGTGGTDGAVKADPVFGTTTFTAGTPGRGAPAKDKNPAHGGDASGKDCIVVGCHLSSWTFGGTLYTDTAGAGRVAGAEIRITGPDGKEFSKTFSDADGNFWTDTPAGAAPPPGSRVGVRNGTKVMNMSGTIGAGQVGCNQAGTCHGAGAGKVFLK